MVELRGVYETDRDEGVLSRQALLRMALQAPHVTVDPHLLPARYCEADNEFLAHTRRNTIAYATGGVMGRCLQRLGLRCIPVANNPVLEGPVYRITRAADFTMSYLEAQMQHLAEVRALRGLRGKITLTIVRHAQTVHNRNHRLTGAWFGTDAGITNEGLETLRELEIPANAIIVHSPLARAHQTAVALADLHGAAALLAAEAGNEMCLGPFEGKPLDHLVQCDGSFQRLFLHGDALGAYPNAECLADLLVRVGFLIDEIVDLAKTRDLEDLHLVFVGHTMINRGLRILADAVFDDARGHYVCDGVDQQFPLMKNGTALTIFEG